MSTLKKCEHEWIQKTGLGYHCRKCRTAQIRPSPSPEAGCLCRNGVRGKHCFDYHPTEARVDWEKEAMERAADHLLRLQTMLIAESLRRIV